MPKLYCPACFATKDSSGPCGDTTCGFVEKPRRPKEYLPYRTLLANRFLIGREIAAGSFSITYVAIDKTDAIPRKLAVKEYFPHRIADRDPKTLSVRSRFTAKRREFDDGLTLFCEGSRICVEITHPNVVSALDFFEDRSKNTAYLVMDYYEGSTLQRVLELRTKLSMAEAIDSILPILDGLEHLHRKNCLHYDITPANIVLAQGGLGDHNEAKPVIIDFNSARRRPIPEGAPLIFHGTPGFAAPEQTPEQISKHGPWTDIYACAATLLMLTTGSVPPSAPDRLDGDDPLPTREQTTLLPAPFANVLTRALSLEPKRRPQSIAEFRLLLKKARASIGGMGPPVSRTPMTDLLVHGAKAARNFWPSIAIVLIVGYLCKLILFDVSVTDTADKRMEPLYKIPSLDYYIFRDASESPNEGSYTEIEGELLSFFRPEARQNSDRGSYAHFGKTVCSCGEPFVYVPTSGNSLVQKVRSCGPSKCRDIQTATRFDRLFTAIGVAIGKSDQQRESLIFLLTDGIPNKGRMELRCSEEVPDGRGMIDQETKDAIADLMRSYPKTYVVLVLAGTDVCLAGIRAQWEKATSNYGDRFYILDVRDDQPVESSLAALRQYLQTKNRFPCVTAWPYREKLRSSQVTDLIEGGTIHTDFCFRSYLDKKSIVFVRRAQLLRVEETTGKAAGRPIWVEVKGSDDNDSEDSENPARVELSSESDWRSRLEREPLYFQLSSKSAKIEKEARYALSIQMEGATACTSFPQALMISASDTSPEMLRKTHQVRLVFYGVLVLFCAFCGCCVYYWFYHDSPRNKNFDYFFVDLFWHWLALFSLVGLMLFIACLRFDFSNLFVWSLGVFQVVDNFLVMREFSALFHGGGTTPKGVHLVEASFSALATTVFAALIGSL